MRRSVQTVLLALAAFVAALAAVGPAAAAKEPCWQTLINDWYDGRIDSVYPVQCYRDALAHMPEDVAQYSSLGDDINRALAAVIAGGSSGSNTTGGGSGSPSGESGSSTFHGGPKADRSAAGVTASAGRYEGGGVVGQGLNSIGPGSASSVPLPLIVLGGLAVLLLALGTAGFVTRRVQTRRATVPPGA